MNHARVQRTNLKTGELHDEVDPALRFAWLTPVYDPVLCRMLPEIALKQRLIAQAQMAAGQRVLGLGAGTGTLMIMVKQSCPGADVVGLDGDPQMLARAQPKAAAAGVALRFDQGLATASAIFQPPAIWRGKL
jgi:2-polyprenyl-3-methyl-5-hydroxy-6-metoxy-1,4-benzoquinol methylase